MRAIRTTLLLCLSLAVMLGGCGIKGPLYLPKPAPVKPAPVSPSTPSSTTP